MNAGENVQSTMTIVALSGSDRPTDNRGTLGDITEYG